MIVMMLTIMMMMMVNMVMMMNMMMMVKDTSDTIALAENHLSIGKSGDCSLSPEREILSSFQNLLFFIFPRTWPAAASSSTVILLASPSPKKETRMSRRRSFQSTGWRNLVASLIKMFA